MNKVLVVAVAAAVTLAGCAETHKNVPVAQASVTVPPGGAAVSAKNETPLPPDAKGLYENSKVRVSRFTIAPGRNVDLPSTPSGMIYALRDCKLRLDSVDGRSYEVDAKKDHVIWSDVAQRNAKAVAGTCELLLVEVKPGPAVGAEPSR
jgi:hypothetical protein